MGNQDDLATAKQAQADAHAARAQARVDHPADSDEVMVADAKAAVADQAVNVAEGREGF